MLTVDVDAKDARAAVRDFRKMIATATAIALTRVAKDGAEAVKDEMRRQFDRPTPYALRAVRSEAARRDTLQAKVFITGADELGGNVDYSPADLLAHQFTGGPRQVKRLELYLRRAGFLGESEFVAPGAAARLDRFGNMSKGQVNQVIAQLRIGLDPASFSNKSARSRRSTRRAGRMFWSRGDRGLPRGVYVDQGPPIGVRPLLAVVRSPRYRRRIDLPAVVQRVVRNTYRQQLELALAQRRR